MMTMTRKQIDVFIRENVGIQELASYMTAPSGHKLGVYQDGTVRIGESVGMEIDPDDWAIAVAKCPGLSNIDMTWWREGWECDHLSDAEVIHDCCTNGYVDDELNTLVEKLVEDASEYWG